jgi:hypothetical protein
MSTRFYTYSQNNTGGSLESDSTNGISHYVIIEAVSAELANAVAKNIGIYFDGCANGVDCDCCGDRWYKVDELDGKEQPTIYGDTDFVFESENVNGYIHYADGRVQGIFYK